MDDIIAGIAKKADASFKIQDGDFERDGLIWCGRCGSPKQKRIMLSGKRTIVACMCNCEDAAYNLEIEETKQRRRMEEIERMRTNGIRIGLQDCKFEADTGKNAKQMEMARRYVSMWDKMKERKVGLLFWGNTGNGKTFTAACIANALIDQGVPTMMTSFPKMLQALQGMRPEDRSVYFNHLNAYELLVIDDLGVERQTEYAQEIVYTVIDQRYTLGKPVVITTNLTLDEMREPSEMSLQRIYDRVTAMCIPVNFPADSFRDEDGKRMRDEARALLYGGA